MGNHYHLLVETPEGNLSRGMRHRNGMYTQRFKRVHERVGHVFQGWYKAIVVQKDAYLVELARYVVLNPVRVKRVRKPGRWPWSSYRATVGAEVGPEWLETRPVLSVFGDNQSEGVERYIRFVAEGKGQPSPWGELKHPLFLGSEAFTEAMRAKVPRGRDYREVLQARPRPTAKPIRDYARAHADRDSAIVAAYASGGYTMKDIGDAFGLHYSRVSKTVGKGDMAKGKT